MGVMGTMIGGWEGGGVVGAMTGGGVSRDVGGLGGEGGS